MMLFVADYQQRENAKVNFNEEDRVAYNVVEYFRKREYNHLTPNYFQLKLNISIPEHSHRAPFTAFQNTQDDLLECLYTHKVKVLGYNEVLILNECFIRPPKEEI